MAESRLSRAELEKKIHNYEAESAGMQARYRRVLPPNIGLGPPVLV